MNDQKANGISEDKSLQTLLVIWAGLLVSQTFFFVLIFITKKHVFEFDFSKPLFDQEAPIIPVVMFVAFSSIVLSFYIRAVFRRKSIDEQNVELVQRALIIACAMCEFSSVIGFVLAVAFDYAYFFILIALGIFATLFHIPRRREIQDATFEK